MIHFHDVSKIYTKPDNEKFYALKNFTYNFDKQGLYCILGKSGSGKSTIANLAALMDSPSLGKITFNGKDISKLKAKEVSLYRSKSVTMVFQHYNLIKDLSVIENVMLPRLAIQEDPKSARKDGLLLLKELGFAENFAEKLANDLSGGEAQRVAIARAIINNPEVIIADEPTGALDEQNSIVVMELLKKLSLKKTVIVITHNTPLALKYADEIVFIKEGELDKVDERKQCKVMTGSKILPYKTKVKKHNRWLYQFSKKRLSKNKGKNALSVLSTVVGLISVFMILGFSYGSKSVINSKCFERFDYGTAEISKTETIELEGSILDLTKLTRLNNNEILDMQVKYPFLTFDVNFDSLFANNTLKINGKEVKGIGIEFIHHFDDEYCDSSLLIKGSLPQENGVIINSNAEEEITKQLGYPSLIGRDLNISSLYQLNTIYDGRACDDVFKFNRSFKISGCSKEFSFLGTPKIYISYRYVKEILQMEIIKTLSTYSQQEITWYDYIKNAVDTDDITSFSHKVFCPYRNLNDLENAIKTYEKIENIDIDSDAYLLKTTFTSLMESVQLGLTIFSILALIGTILIIGINAFSSYAFERKQSAIYFAFGVSKSQVFTMFIIESIIVTLLAYLISVIGAFGIQKIANFVIYKYFDISNLINIPFMTFHNIPYFLLIVGLVFSLTVCIVFTYLPLAFSKKINLKKELGDE